MCGILGVLSGDVDAMRGRFDAWRDRLAHRGPDQAGTFAGEGVLLGFRRLAILDLSPTGAQPMTSPDGRHTIVFNGEIYNHRAIRRDLEVRGERFAGTSDTEVLLRLLARDGPASLARLNGMFALAVHDAREHTVLLARDRLGVKPLFLFVGASSIAFASEVRALRDAPGFPSSLAAGALAAFFRVGSVPGWTSVFEGLQQVEPGTWTRLSVDERRVVEQGRFWDLPPVRTPEERRGLDDWVDELEALLVDATAARLQADVPLGIFLSGGIDSGLVAAAASRSAPGIECITAAFPGHANDEAALAAETAAHLGLPLRRVEVRGDEVISSLRQRLEWFDEPFADFSALPTSLICAAARERVTVVLTGDGGDEAFGGYSPHSRASAWQWFDRLPRGPFRALRAVSRHILPGDSRLHRVIERFPEPVGDFGVGATLYPFAHWPEETLVHGLVDDPDGIVDAYRAANPPADGTSAVDASQRRDLTSYLRDDVLVKVDRMSMRHSIEARSPFLDYRVVEFGLRLPVRYRSAGGVGKVILRRLAERWLPPSVTVAPKRGFGVPLLEWMRDPQASRSIRDALGSLSAKGAVIVDDAAAVRLYDQAQHSPVALDGLRALVAFSWWWQAAGRPAIARRGAREDSHHVR